MNVERWLWLEVGLRQVGRAPLLEDQPPEPGDAVFDVRPDHDTFSRAIDEGGGTVRRFLDRLAIKPLAEGQGQGLEDRDNSGLF